MSKIAKKFGLTVAQLEAANPQIKNPNNIKIGDKINIPSAAPSDVISGARPAHPDRRPIGARRAVEPAETGPDRSCGPPAAMARPRRLR